MNRPSSALGLLLGFLALTMFAVSSTSRSTTIKPATSYADRAAIRRQAALSRMSALTVATETVPASNALSRSAATMPDLTDLLDGCLTSSRPIDCPNDLQTLDGAAIIRLTPAAVEPIRDTTAAFASNDGRIVCDELCEDMIFGQPVTTTLISLDNTPEKTRELSASEITTVFQSILREKSTGSRNARGKSQRRASLEGLRSLPEELVRLL